MPNGLLIVQPDLDVGAIARLAHPVLEKLIGLALANRKLCLGAPALRSHILLAPIWMLGLSLLYVDERVRHEGYDIELMAARQLPEMPKLPGVVSPFAPALVTGRAPKFVPPPPGQMNTGSVLGLS